jgi:hypothetical protein
VFHAFEQSRRLVKSDVGRGVNGHPKLIVHGTRALIWMNQASEFGRILDNFACLLQFLRCRIDAINELGARLSCFLFERFVLFKSVISYEISLTSDN